MSCRMLIVLLMGRWSYCIIYDVRLYSMLDTVVIYGEVEVSAAKTDVIAPPLIGCRLEPSPLFFSLFKGTQARLYSYKLILYS